MRKNILLLLLALGLPAAAAATETIEATAYGTATADAAPEAGNSASLAAMAAENGHTITAIRVNGLKRTREKVVQNLLADVLNARSDSLDRSGITARLLETGIFENIKLDVVPGVDGAVLSVSVDEKWSVIPVPVFVASSDGLTAGGAIIDANAFGLNDKLFLVGLMLPGGWMASGAWVDTPASRRGAGWTVSLFVSSRDERVADETDNDIARFHTEAAAAALALKFPLPQKIQGRLPISASAAAAWKTRRASDADKDPLETPGSASAAAAQLNLSSSSSAWDGVFVISRSADLEYSYNFGIGSSSWGEARASAELQRSIIPGLKGVAKGTVSGQFGENDVFRKKSDEIPVSILPPAYAADALAGFSAGLEARALQLPAAVVSVLAAWQCASTGTGAGTSALAETLRFDHGVASGIRLYISKVAIPAMDIGASYNLTTGFYRMSFGIGMRM